MRPALTLAVLGLLCSTANAQAPDVHTGGLPSARTYVIVHGAWGCGCSFQAVGDSLVAHGHRVFRPSLTGLGDRVHLATPEVSLGTHIDDVVNLLRYEELTDVVLVGHSYGGMVISGVADRVPERVARLVYLDAFVPEDGEALMDLAGPLGPALESWTRDGFVVPPWVESGAAPPADVPQPARTFRDPISLTNGAAGRLPGTYILTVDPGATEDQFSPFAERARGRGWDVEEMEADHNPQWSAVGVLVGRLLALP